MLVIILLIVVVFFVFFFFKLKTGANYSLGNFRAAIFDAKKEIMLKKNIAANKFILAEIYQRRDLFEDALREITFHPREAVNNDYIEPEEIIARAEGYNLGMNEYILTARETIAENRNGANLTPIVRSDPQNVHDSFVNVDVRKKIDMLKNSPVLIPPHSSHVDRMLENPAEIYGTTDAEIMCRVWGRINEPENAPNRAELIRAFNSAVEQCGVCSTGRVSQLIDSLTLLDCNAELAAPLVSREIMRREIGGKISAEIAKLSREDRNVYETSESDDELDPVREKIKINVVANCLHLGPAKEKIFEEFFAAL